MKTDGLISCRDYVLEALRNEAEKRSEYPDWIDREHQAVAVAANEWAASHGVTQRTTVADVTRLEPLALGHVDYAEKFALYVAEHVLGRPA